ncbi:MAG: hypothetical protein GY756_23685, partial [bacterium]|nr:hypothetical protein [bacterium]
ELLELFGAAVGAVDEYVFDNQMDEAAITLYSAGFLPGGLLEGAANFGKWGKANFAAKFFAGPADDILGDLSKLGPLDEGIANGVKRATQFSENWPKASLDETIARIAGNNPIVSTTTSGKTLYRNPTNGMQVVHDNAANYFRVQNLNATGKASYTTIYGNALPNNVKLIKSTKTTQTGLTKDIWQAMTHFANID